jgi:hypothetical protein
MSIEHLLLLSFFGGVHVRMDLAVLDSCSFRALANNPRGSDRAKWITKMVGRSTINE